MGATRAFLLSLFAFVALAIGLASLSPDVEEGAQESVGAGANATERATNATDGANETATNATDGANGTAGDAGGAIGGEPLNNSTDAGEGGIAPALS